MSGFAKVNLLVVEDSAGGVGGIEARFAAGT
jgi:hypothetical protein